MLKDRGYNINDSEMTDEKINDYWSDWQFGEGEQKQVKAETYQKKMRSDEDPEISVETIIAVFWKCDQDKINTEEMKLVETQCDTINSVKRQKMMEQGDDPNSAAKITRAILIVRDQTALTKKYDSADNITLEIFNLDDLQVNITKHKLVPKHCVLTPDEKMELLEKYKIKEHQLPKIQQADPIAKYFGVKQREVMKIIRPSETAGRYVTYRIVI